MNGCIHKFNRGITHTHTRLRADMRTERAHGHIYAYAHTYVSSCLSIFANLYFRTSVLSYLRTCTPDARVRRPHAWSRMDHAFGMGAVCSVLLLLICLQ